MSEGSRRPVLIAEPGGRRGRDGVLSRLQDALEAAGQAFDTRLAGPGHDPVELARHAADEDRPLVVAVGGDGLVHQVVNGLVDVEQGRARSERTVLGVVAGPSGCDFSRTFGLDLVPEKMVHHLLSEPVFPIDLGRVRYRTSGGRAAASVFANVAEAGYGGVLSGLSAHMPTALGRVGQLLAALLAVWRAGHPEVHLAVDHTELREPMSSVVVANGQFFRGGMRVAPRALPDDGSFSVLCWLGTPGEVFTAMPRLRVGEHLGGGDVREYQSTTVELQPADTMVLEADGRVLGTTPASFEVLPGVLDLAI